MAVFRRNIFLFVLFFLFITGNTRATHIVGGEMNYRYLGSDNYEIRLTVFRDCFNGIPPFDDPASIGIFDASGNLVFEILTPLLFVNTVPHIINSPCLVPPTNVCYEVTTYIDTINLPSNSGGYVLSYQRCCRNGSITNIVNPGDAGATYLATIPSSSLSQTNSNPVFVNYPPTFICRGYPFTFNHAAFDFDGDSLVYSLFDPLDGASSGAPMPQPPNPPPYIPITWQSPYSLANVFGGVPLTIDPNTGVITATPNTIGQFVYGVRVKEYHNGIFLSETRREFQVNVINCVGLVVAAIQSPIILCGSFTANFTNSSVGAVAYKWDFGDPSTTADTSVLAAPSYTYPDTGTYQVKLIALSGTNPLCNDTTFAVVHVYPPLVAEMGMLFDKCVNAVFFYDSTVSNSGTVNFWDWNFGDGVHSNTSSSVHAYSAPGTYIVTLNIGTNAGCTDAITDTITIFPQLISFVDSIKPAICLTTCTGSALVTPIGGVLPYSIQWSNGDTTVFADSLCPGTYTVSIVDSNGCLSAQYVEIGTTYNTLITNVQAAKCEQVCNGTAEVIPDGGNAPYSFIWSNGDTTSMADSLCTGIYYVTATDSNGCVLTDSVEITQLFFSDFSAFNNVRCFGECNGSVTIGATGGDSPYTYVWNTGFVGTPATNLCPGTYIITTTDINGCTEQDTIVITEPDLLVEDALKNDSRCPGDCNGTVEVTNSGGTTPYVWSWNQATPISTSSMTNLCPGWQLIETIDANGCTAIDSIQIVDLFTNPEITASTEMDSVYLGQSTQLTGSPGAVYEYLWDNPSTLDNPTISNPVSTPDQTVTYLLKVTDSNGCVNYDTVTVFVITDYCKDGIVFVPNAFTPDGNGRNDKFFVRAKGVKETHIAIYDRWGEKVFESNDWSEGWDGTFKGAPAKADVYVYYLTTICYDNNKNFKKGNLTLIR